jgi:hypothetical protein
VAGSATIGAAVGGSMSGATWFGRRKRPANAAAKATPKPEIAQGNRRGAAGGGAFAATTAAVWIEEAADAAPRFARLERDIAGDPEEPRRDPLGIAEGIHAAEGARERLLERVVRGGAIAQQPLEKAADPRPMLRVHGGEERGIRRSEPRCRALFRGLGRVLGDHRRRHDPGVGEEGHAGTVARWPRGLQVVGDFFPEPAHPARDAMNLARSFSVSASILAPGWGDDPEDHWDIDHDLSVIYTLVEKPR